MPPGVVINGDVRGGSDVRIEHQVTIGAERRRAPVLGDGVFIGAGAKIIGSVHVGDDVRIGANAVVVRDVPAALHRRRHPGPGRAPPRAGRRTRRRPHRSSAAVALTMRRYDDHAIEVAFWICVALIVYALRRSIRFSCGCCHASSDGRRPGDPLPDDATCRRCRS